MEQEIIYVNWYSRQLSIRNSERNNEAPRKETHRIIMNIVLVQTPNFVVFLHLFAFIRTTLLQRIQQLSLNATKSWGTKRFLMSIAEQKIVGSTYRRSIAMPFAACLE